MKKAKITTAYRKTTVAAKKRLDEDIRAILNTGNIELKCGVRIGRDITFNEIREKYDAVYLGLGAQIGNRMPMDNADAGNVIPAADFLQLVANGKAPDLTGKKVVLIGGGNVAMDAARCAKRLGKAECGDDPCIHQEKG